MNPLVRFSLLIDFKIPYSELEHLLALPAHVRKEEVLRIIRTTTPGNHAIMDHELEIVQEAMSKAYWQGYKAARKEQLRIEANNAIPAMGVL